MCTNRRNKNLPHHLRDHIVEIYMKHQTISSDHQYAQKFEMLNVKIIINKISDVVGGGKARGM